MYCRNIKTLHSTHVCKCPKRVGLKTCSYRLRCLEAAICCKLQVYLKYLILWWRQVIQVHVFQLFAPVWAVCTVGISVVIRGKCYTFILPPWEYVFALIHIVCVLVCAHTHTHTLHHGQTTCLSHGSFHKAVCPSRTDSIWKICLNESTHQLHQHVLTSPPSPLSLCLFPTSLYSSLLCPCLLSILWSFQTVLLSLTSSSLLLFN